jgi:hypothetical protein
MHLVYDEEFTLPRPISRRDASFRVRIWMDRRRTPVVLVTATPAAMVPPAWCAARIGNYVRRVYLKGSDLFRYYEHAGPCRPGELPKRVRFHEGVDGQYTGSKPSDATWAEIEILVGGPVERP